MQPQSATPRESKRKGIENKCFFGTVESTEKPGKVENCLLENEINKTNVSRESQ
jgi:hypothetical protein